MKIFNRNKIFFIKSIIPLLILAVSSVFCSEKIPLVLNDKNTKEITSYILKAENNPELTFDIAGIINDNFIDITVPYGIDLTSLRPDIKIIGSSVTPDASQAVDFSKGAVTYTVTASDKTKKDYSVIVNLNSSSEKKITSFKFSKDLNTELLTSDYTCSITDPDPDDSNSTGTITVIVPNPNDPIIMEYYLIPSIKIIGKSISPEDGENVDFWLSRYGPVKYTVTAEDDSTVDYNVSVDHTLNSYKEISEYKIYSNVSRTSEITCPDCTMEIDTALNKIEIKVPYNLSGTIYPEITALGVQSISPSPDDPIVLVKDLSDTSGCSYLPVQYTITAQDTSTATYTVIFSGLSGDNAITNFQITSLGVTGVINNQNSTVAAIVPNGTSRSSLTPTIAISTGATISPASGTAHNFITPFTYTVRSQSGVARNWTVTIIEAQNNQCDITSFKFNIPGGETATGIISSGPPPTIKVNIMTLGTSLNGLAPVITISGVSVSPASGVAQNFSPVTPVVYTVTAQDNTQKIYYVYAKVLSRMTVLLPSSDYSKGLQYPSGTHYNLVNEPPETSTSTVDSTYVENNATYGADQYDLYNATPYNADSEYGTGTVSKVIIKYRARREIYYIMIFEDIHGEAWDTINIGGTNANGPEIPLSTRNYWYALSNVWTVAPDGAWNWTKINNLKIGVTLSNHIYNYVVGGGRSNVLCSQVYAEVYYTLSSSW